MTTTRRILERARVRFLAMWRSRGGGFYSLVALMTFLYWQGAALVAFVAHPRIPDIGLGWIVGRLLARISIDFTWSVLWPLGWLGRYGPVKGALLVVGAVAAYRFLKPIVLPLLDAPAPLSSPGRATPPPDAPAPAAPPPPAADRPHPA